MIGQRLQNKLTLCLSLLERKHMYASDFPNLNIKGPDISPNFPQFRDKIPSFSFIII